MKEDFRPLIVSIWCLTYNHEKYIRQCLDGFVMQKTNFRFEAIVHDDASTDGTADIVREYAEKYPDIIKPIIERENQYSKQDGSLDRIMQTVCIGEYIALCEGDDYWIDPLKLQKQVDWLEEHSDYTMCCSDAKIETPNGELVWSRYDKDTDISPEEMIRGGGSFIQTASIIFRRSILIDYPDCCKQCKVGDYPLQIWATIKGKVRYLDCKTVVYRFGAENSFSANRNYTNIKIMIEERRSEIDMLQGLDKYSKGLYHSVFVETEVGSVYYFLDVRRYKWRTIANAFPDVIKNFNRLQKNENWLICHNLTPFVQSVNNFCTDGLIPALLALPGVRNLYSVYKKVIEKN